MSPPSKRNRPWIRILSIGACVVAVAWLGIRLSTSGPLEQARNDARRGARHKAMQGYLDFLEGSPKAYDVRLELAELLKPVDPQFALTHLQKIPDSAPEYPDAVLHIAHISVANRQDDLAEQSLRKLDELRPNDAGVSLSLAELYYRTGRYQDALPWIRQAIEIQPDRALSWLLLAETLDYLKRPGEMPEPLRKAIELDPDLYAAHANLAYALQFAGQLEAAETEARWCLQRSPNDVRVRRWLAMILRDGGQHDAAMEEIRKATKHAPQDVACRIMEADLLLFQRKAEAAYNVLLPLYEQNSNRRDYLGSLARAAAVSGRSEEAKRYQQEIVKLIGSAPDPLESNSTVPPNTDF